MSRETGWQQQVSLPFVPVSSWLHESRSSSIDSKSRLLALKLRLSLAVASDGLKRSAEYDRARLYKGWWSLCKVNKNQQLWTHKDVFKRGQSSNEGRHGKCIIIWIGGVWVWAIEVDREAGWGGGDTGDKLFSQPGGVVRKSSQVMDQHLCTTKLVRLSSLLTVTQPK